MSLVDDILDVGISTLYENLYQICLEEPGKEGDLNYVAETIEEIFGPGADEGWWEFMADSHPDILREFLEISQDDYELSER